ncbi:VirB2 family type IV secretion system major pilin TrwL [Bartonella sp. CB169]|uniref:VirB2 family type IV secretion system major pilin TrwL n=1 Tax=Bartonella sp. CB169 TaxID=3112257 RepID=UPI00300E5041
MKWLNILQKAVHNKVITVAIALIMFFVAHPLYAQGLEKAERVLKQLQGQLNTIIPIVATVILLCLAISYAGRFIEKSTFIRWAIGVIIAGSAAEIANMLFKP